MHAPLTPIVVNGPFDRVGVDVIQFPQSHSGNQYAVVFMDYLTKWPEVYPTPDQSAATIANLLVREIVSRHGLPWELLSDRGRAFLSGLLKEVQLLLGFKKLNTSAYHPHTDRLVERFNRTLTSMLAKIVERGGKDWDEKLPYVLFAYRASQQRSTLESPFYLLCGRDPRLPVDQVMSPKKARRIVDLKEYGAQLAGDMSEAWELARECVWKAQRRQKEYHDRKVWLPVFRVGDRVFLYKPADKTGPARKFARPYHGPFRVVETDSNTARIQPIDRPEEDPVLVVVDRLRNCPTEAPDVFWSPKKSKSAANFGGKADTSQGSQSLTRKHSNGFAMPATSEVQPVPGEDLSSRAPESPSDTGVESNEMDNTAVNNEGISTQTERAPDTLTGGCLETSPKEKKTIKWSGCLRRLHEHSPEDV